MSKELDHHNEAWKASINNKNTMPQSPQEDWKEEFREYFDKTLKPIKPAMKNLDRELMVDFISNLIQSEREYMKQKAIACLPNYKKDYDGNDIESASEFYGIAADSWSEIIRYEDGLRDCREQTLSALREI